tara:strand:- start:142 stop:477 length:336 start_codon:yes stop_codon:yes gene_type:complete
MTDSIKYQKRSCYKGKLNFMSLNRHYKDTYEVLFHIGGRQCRFITYKADVVAYINRCLPDEKITIWFIVKSNQYKGKYYTDCIIQFVESLRLKEIDYQKEINNIPKGDSLY